MKRLIFDTANLLFRVASAHGKYNTDGTPEERAGLALHMALNSLNKYYKKYRPDQVAVTFEGPKNWRKDYTKSAACISKKVYKANRVKDPSMEPFFELIGAFEQLARNHTSLVCLSAPELEGDDVLGGYVNKYAPLGDEIIIVSGDKDFAQLLKYPNVQLIDPDKGKPRSLIDLCGVDDAAYFMFEKCFRGDKGDNVFPALPRVFKKRLQKAYTDDYELTKLLNETFTFTDPDSNQVTEYLVQDLFLENSVLMNLECQPDDIRKLIIETVDAAEINRGKYSHFHFTKFCGKYGLKQIAENAQAFSDMFSNKVMGPSPGSPIKKPLINF